MENASQYTRNRRQSEKKTHLVDNRRLLLLPPLLLPVNLLNLDITLESTGSKVPETDEAIPTGSEKMRRGGRGSGGKGERARADGGDGSLVQGEGVESLRSRERSVGGERDGRDLVEEGA
jgi:hypothetical protein